ncbi:FAD-binding domain-containing protein [Aspergillus cavernicola]|uniref:FAD-binding domain-containing protein n=1 Tax=Aspergillus cavernicola TaxID=176166 RepID=A0ABR4HCG8_9EURO
MAEQHSRPPPSFSGPNKVIDTPVDHCPSSILFKAFVFLAAASSAFAKCRCSPSDDCWPSLSSWSSLNTTVGGKLIAKQPLAKSCYQGGSYDAQRCEKVTASWTNSSFQEASPIGNSSLNPVCVLGPAPDHNVRLVIKNTSHDIVGRSQGYGSLSIWIKNITNGIQFQDHCASSTQCRSNWTGGAFTVRGGYVWGEVYAEAARHGVIAVGGSDRTIGVIGGYLQGGGHGVVTHDFGLATDQVLEYKVILASGEPVTANECQYSELFMALRGGGGGTYGVVVSATIKAHPTRPVLLHSLAIIPAGNNISDFHSAIAYMLSRFPHFSDGGFSGNGLLVEDWYTHAFTKLLGSNTTQYDIQSGKNTIQRQIIDHLAPLNGTKFNGFFENSREHQSGVGTSAVLPSRFFDKKSLISQQENLQKVINTMFTGPEPEITTTSYLELCLIGGGKVLESAPLMSVNPAWRRTYLLMELAETWSENDGLQGSDLILDDVTNRKLKAMKDAAPGMGTYVNEADQNELDYKRNWYRDMYDWLEFVKDKYDPDRVFWCYRCVASKS